MSGGRKREYVAALAKGLAAERTLVVYGETESVTHVVEQGVERFGPAQVGVLNGDGAQKLRHARRRLRAARKSRFDRNNVGDKQILNRSEARLDVRHTHSPATLSPGRMTEAAGASSSGRGGRRIVAWLGAAVLVSLTAECPAEARQHEASDGYVFEGKEFTNLKFEVRIVEHPDFTDLLAALPGGGPPRSIRKVKAWSKIGADGSCEIHIVDQAKFYTPDAIGHELAHCIYGRWHS